ncbi:MAG TPA: FAD-linked oxidase C-terminal domain-containing protein [Opitutales bacterium]|nr:FAD-linked oxidase C-terminal domain-containing protein [Opitutales bacterium]
MPFESRTAALAAQLGPEVVKTDAAALFAASLDNARLSFLPEAVLFPRNEDDVAAILLAANAGKVPVTTRGGGTATTGAASPVLGGWALDLSGWKNLHIDAETGIAYVQPGVITATLSAEAEKLGWFYPPDPSSSKYSTIGGNIACNAGGMRGARYGVTRDYVMALEGFLPTGKWVRWGGDLRKWAVGYNMRDLWVGSEGTLGVITGAVLRLIAKPAARATFLFAFEDEFKALALSRAIFAARLPASIMEFLDRQSVGCTIAEGLKLPLDLSGGTPAVLLVELDGDAEKVELAAAALEALAKPVATALRRAASPQEAETLWEVRRRCSKSMFRLADGKLNEDIVIPPRAQDELMAFTLDLKERCGLATPVFGHAGDGNFHVHVMYRLSDASDREKAEKAVTEIMAKVIGLGGAISGEHGIGLAKQPFLPMQLSSDEIAAMQAVKKALDPNGILNPGKVFGSFRIWEHPRADVTLPWD